MGLAMPSHAALHESQSEAQQPDPTRMRAVLGHLVDA
jgi:hypothetical protein